MVKIFACEPSEALKDLIDECLNHVLELEHLDRPQTTLGKCADYAVVGAAVLTQLFPGSFAVVAGSKIIDRGSGHYFVLSAARTVRRKARILEHLREYHCWIEYRPTDSDHSNEHQKPVIIDLR